MSELEPRAGEELERQLDRYARVRLDPSHAEAKRARSTLMEAAWRQRIGAPASVSSRSRSDTNEPSVTGAALTVVPASRTATHPSGRAMGRGIAARRIGISIAAAVLAGLTIGTSVFAASRAGGPLYETRVALEELTLPADRDARLEAELAHAQSRLAEIVDAATRDDPQAVAAAVRAYLTSLDDIDDSIGALADRALVAIESHRAVLLNVLGEAPEEAHTGLQNALLQSGTVITRLSAAGTPDADGATGTGAGSGAGTRDGNAGGARGAVSSAGTVGGGSTGGRPVVPKTRPVRTPRPARTPAPATTDRPAPTPPHGGRP